MKSIQIGPIRRIRTLAALLLLAFPLHATTLKGRIGSAIEGIEDIDGFGMPMFGRAELYPAVAGLVRLPRQRG
jgi:hypothetical protein